MRPSSIPIVSTLVTLSIVSALALAYAAEEGKDGRTSTGEAKKAAAAKKTKKSTRRASKSEGKAQAAAPADLAEAVKKTVASKNWEAGVVVLDESGKVLVSISADQALSPASNQKILVVGAALGLVGPDFTYETSLAAPGAPAGGAIKDLIVRGTGDPNIPNRFENQDPTLIFRNWAAELKKKGVAKVTGDIVIDDSYFDDVRFLPGWKDGQQANWYQAEVGAVNLNDNCIEVEARPTSPGQPAEIKMTPSTSYVKVENNCRTVAQAQNAKKLPIFNRKDGTNTIVVTGEISTKRKVVESPPITIEDPGIYFGTVLSEVLDAEGISIGGKVVRGKLAERGGPSPVTLHQHKSTLALDLKVINKHSQNLHAEILLKAIGAKKGGEGSLAGGTRAVESFLKTAGIAAPGLSIQDGSGLAAGNRISPSTLAGVLGWMSKQPFFKMYRDSLPIANVDGTLKRRFRGKACAGHVYAKTGYIKGVSALSGYVERGGKHRVFAVILNRIGGNLQDARRVEEEIAEMTYLSMPQ
jgi:D-alanyl-D-alanine carboxypeptidase/D-alanyl-D-alanine-endopeptidase (penicillin-binding protein 4)